MEDITTNFYLTENLLNKLSDEALGALCSTSKRFQKYCENDEFWQLRSHKYLDPFLIQFKDKLLTWKQFYAKYVQALSKSGLEMIIAEDNVRLFDYYLKLYPDINMDIYSSLDVFIAKYGSQKMYRYIIDNENTLFINWNSSFGIRLSQEIYDRAVENGKTAFMRHIIKTYPNNMNYDSFYVYPITNPRALVDSFDLLYSFGYRPIDDDLDSLLTSMLIALRDKSEKRYSHLTIYDFIPSIRWFEQHGLSIP